MRFPVKVKHRRAAAICANYRSYPYEQMADRAAGPRILRSFSRLLGAMALLVFAASSSAAIIGETWVQRYNHPTVSSDGSSTVITDSAGNVVVAGYTAGFVSGADWLVLKYSNDGALLWAHHYSGPGISSEEPHDVAAGQDGRIVATGYVWNGSDKDMLTIAYSGDGLPLWTNRYDGPAHSTDVAMAVALDANGDVYVAGSTHRSGNSDDFIVLKYSALGVPAWTNYYNGPDHGSDGAGALGLANGKLFVAGNSVNNQMNGFITIAYTESGVPLWTNRFDQPGTTIHLSDMKVDASGNVFLGGQNAVVAYSEAGALLWTHDHSGPASIAVGDNGCTAVAQFSQFVTILYSPSGLPLWTNRYSGSGNLARAVTIDGNGNVFVTGESDGTSNWEDFVTIAYSAEGVPLWTNRYDGPLDHDRDRAQAIALDTQGNIFVVGLGSDDIATIKYSGVGAPLWTNQYNWPGNRGDYPQAVIIGPDPDRNVYVTGASQDQSGGTLSLDYLTLAYTPGGVLLWSKRYNGPLNRNDSPNAIAVTSGGTVLVTGYSDLEALGNVSDVVTIAYSSAGVPLWTNIYNGPANGEDKATAIAVGTNDIIFVTGYATVGFNRTDYLTIAYDNSGAALWTNRYSASTSSSAKAAAIVADSHGNALVTGTAASDYATISYSAAGTPLWTNRFDGNSLDNANDIAVDAVGNVYVTGSAHGISYDYVTIKYSNAGVPLWTHRYNGSAGNSDVAMALVVDGSGRVFVTGYSIGGGIIFDYATVAISSSGTTLWARRYNPSGDDAKATSVRLDPDGNVVVTGSARVSEGDYDLATIIYNQWGVPLWNSRYDGPANGDDKSYGKGALAIGSDGSIYVVGGSDGDYGSSTMEDFVVIKYSDAPTLAVRRLGSMVEVSWPPSFVGAQLQQKTASVQKGWSTNWATVPNSTLTNLWLFTPTSDYGFFRLLNP